MTTWSLSRATAHSALLGTALFTAGCMATTPEPLPPAVDPSCLDCGIRSSGFKEALEAMVATDRTQSWSQSKCDEISRQFLDASEDVSAYWPEPIYNAAVTKQRCSEDVAARELYQGILAKSAGFHRARVQLARIDLSAGKLSVDLGIAEMHRAVLDANYQNVEALTELARLQMQRDNAVPDVDGATDMARAKKNLQRALAVDDAHMPTMNQLGIYYLTMAKRAGGDEGLDLALLVTSQGIRRDQSYAPLRNTAGLIFYEMGDLTRASASFDTARRLDPRFFDAHMNFASLNVMVRGFAAAEDAYRKAIALKPNDYDAHLGLALALRGQIESARDREATLDDAEETLRKARALDSKRPEAYFNLGILYESYRASSTTADGNRALDMAIAFFQEFAEKAKGKPEFASAVEDVLAVPTKTDDECMKPEAADDKACKRGRIHDLRDLMKFRSGQMGG